MTNEQDARAPKGPPERTCAGCGARTPADELLRVVLGPSGAADGGGHEVAVDIAASAFGRGAHVHPSKECLAKAARSGFARAFKTKVSTSAEDLAAQIVAGVDRRIEGLIVGARRGRLVVMGADTVVETLRNDSAELLIVACDAAAALKLPGVEQFIGDGRAVAWGDKKRLGALFGRDDVAICAVLHPGVANSIAHAHRTSRPFVGSRSEAWLCSEVR